MHAETPLMYNPFDPAIRADPYPAYAYMREHAPVHRSPLGVYVLSRYADIGPLLRDPRMSSDIRNAGDVWFLQQPGARERMERRSKTMLFADPPDHTRLRRLVNAAFTPRVIEALAPRVRALTDELIAGFDGDEVDLIPAFAYPLPVRIIAELLGVPGDDLDRFRSWSDRLARSLDPLLPPDLIADVVRAADDVDEYFARLVAERRAHPRDDLVSALAAIEQEGDRLSEEELLSMCRLLIVAGHETTMNLIGNGMNALLRAPEQAALVREHDDIADTAVEELLRFDSPVQLTGRIALEDVEIGGETIPAKTFVLLLLGAANRDGDRFTDPDRIDVARADNRHLAFGGGPHFCVGAPLARLEARIAIPTLLRRFPGLSLASEDVKYRDTVTLRGLTSLPLRLR